MHYLFLASKYVLGLFEVLGFKLNGQDFFIYIHIKYGLFLQDCFPFDRSGNIL